MKHLRYLLFPLLLLVATPAAGQVSDTTLVIIEGDLAEVRIQVPDTTISIGDTIFFFAETVDSDGDPVSALLTWSTSNAGALVIDAASGVAVALTKNLNGVEVYVQAVKVGAMHLASFQDGQLNWSGNDTINCQVAGCADRPTLQYCAYLVDPNQRLLVENPGPPTCPIVFTPAPRPTSLFPAFPRPAYFLVIPV